MLISERKFGFDKLAKAFFPDASDPVESAIVKDAVQCPDFATCFIWAAEYQNVTTIVDDFDLEVWRLAGKLTDDNNKPLLCELEDGVVRTIDFVIMFRKGSPFLH